MKITFERIKENPDYYPIVVKFENEVIGFAKAIIHHDFFENNNPFMTIWSVRVKENYRKQGIGIKLFQYIEQLAKDKKCEFICLLAEKGNIPANNFYQKLGYECENGYVKMLSNT